MISACTPSLDPRPAGGMAEIQRQVAEAYRLPIEAVKLTSRRSEVVRARQEFMWRCRQVKWPDGAHRYTTTQIAAFLGLDHTTVVYGVRRHEERRAKAA